MRKKKKAQVPAKSKSQGKKKKNSSGSKKLGTGKKSVKGSKSLKTPKAGLKGFRLSKGAKPEYNLPEAEKISTRGFKIDSEGIGKRLGKRKGSNGIKTRVKKESGSKGLKSGKSGIRVDRESKKYKLAEKKAKMFAAGFDFGKYGVKKALGNVGRKELDRMDRNVYKRIWGRRKAIKELPRTKGWKSKRSELYKEIVELNRYRQYLAFFLGKELHEEPEFKKEQLDVKKGLRTYSYNVWQFEEVLNDYIRAEDFTTFVFINTGKTMKLSKSTPSAILFEFDRARDAAYSRPLGGTPIVEVTEDYENKRLGIEVVV